MIRVAEAVLNGHPDKFCDILADRVLAAVYAADPKCSAQIEVAVWSDILWFSGGIVTHSPFQIGLPELVCTVGREIGYTSDNHIDAERYRIHNEFCYQVSDPLSWNENVNDQSIVVGWAGYGEQTHYLPPEQFLVHALRNALIESCRQGILRQQGPDGKLLVRLREESSLRGRGVRWILEHILVTLQQTPNVTGIDLAAHVNQTLSAAYARLRHRDPRWVCDWTEVELLVNPNGALLFAGSDGDNGQTGRKLVMDYYGPRVPIGGGALSGKDLTHIDRIGAYGARAAALHAVTTGAETCKITVVYAPNHDVPLDVIYEMEGRGEPLPREWFAHHALVQRFACQVDVGGLGQGIHFFDPTLPWNQPKRPLS